MIQVDQLTKVYRVPRRAAGFTAALRSLLRREHEDVTAVSNLTFSIAQGERVGFLGPNGAGKTTTLKILSGLLMPTSGRVTVGGFQPQDRAYDFLRTITLVMGQKQQLIWDLPPVDTFELQRAIYDLPRAQYQETLDELIALLGLEPLLTRPVRNLSLGERMKCELAAALLHRPKLLFLDEPTIGLDVSMQASVRAFIKTYNERHGATVLLTSHDMDDVQALCPRVIIIDKGRLRYDGDLTRLAATTLPDKRISLTFHHDVRAEDLSPFGQVVELQDRRAVLRCPQQGMAEQVSRMLGTLPVLDLTVEDPPLEDVMRQLLGGVP
ncbi:MAG: ATP-binding cassette domain-containing protein [Myxococcota bacterium]